MLNNRSRLQVVEIWCLSVMTIGAWSVVSGAALTMVNGELLFATCTLPPLIMLMMWRHRTPVAVAVTAADFQLGGNLRSEERSRLPPVEQSSALEPSFAQAGV